MEEALFVCTISVLHHEHIYGQAMVLGANSQRDITWRWEFGAFPPRRLACHSKAGCQPQLLPGQPAAFPSSAGRWHVHCTGAPRLARRIQTEAPRHTPAPPPDTRSISLARTVTSRASLSTGTREPMPRGPIAEACQSQRDPIHEQRPPHYHLITVSLAP